MTWRGAGLSGVVAGTLCAGGAYATAWLSGGTSPAAPWLMVACIALTLPGTVLLGAGRSTRQPWLIGAAVVLVILLPGVLAAALLLPHETPADRLLLGLPRRLALVVYGIGLVPALILPLAFARDFRDDGLDPDGLKALRDECARLRGESS